MKISQLRQVSRRYVKAFFDVASQAACVEEVEKDLLALAKAARVSKEFAGFLTNPLLTRAQQANLMEAMLNNIGAHVLTQAFARMLARQKRLPALGIIAEVFAETAAKSRGELAADVVSAAELKVGETGAIADRLGKIYGKKITVRTRVNPELIGGVVIKIGSTQLDGSLAGKLERLGQKLKKVA